MRQSAFNEIFADLELARRLERTEACGRDRVCRGACAVRPRRVGRRWIEVAGAAALYDGAVVTDVHRPSGSACGQELTESDLDRIEALYGNVVHRSTIEVSPLADVGDASVARAGVAISRSR
jgi:hypothetical protein